MVEESPNSKWWYGIVITMGLSVVYDWIVLTVSATGPQDPSDTDLTTVVIWILLRTITTDTFLFLLTVGFVACFVADWRRVRESETDWTPSPAYLLVPAVSLANFVLYILSLTLMILGGAYYLYQRSAHIGVVAEKFPP